MAKSDDWSEETKAYTADLAGQFAVAMLQDGGEEDHLLRVPDLAWRLADLMRQERQRRSMAPS